MSREYWDDITGIGTMYMEMELVVGLETVLFVCENNEKRWLFMTYDSADGDYVFCPIENETLLHMLKNEITMEEAYRSAEFIGETFIDDEDKLCYRKYDASEFCGERLPDKGAFYEIQSDYIMNYINKLQKQRNVEYTVLDYEYSDFLDEIQVKVKKLTLDSMVEKWYASGSDKTICKTVRGEDPHNIFSVSDAEQAEKQPANKILASADESNLDLACMAA